MDKTATNPNKVSVIVLAAGLSQRMGDDNKLHLLIDGQPMLQRTLNVLLASDLAEMVVVLGHDRHKTQTLVRELGVRTVVNEYYQSGQMSSVHCGLSALQQPAEGVMIALADQPALTVDDINHLITAFLNRSHGQVVIPMYQKQRGNPIIFSESCRQDILTGNGNAGCRKFIDRHPELVEKVAMSNPAVIIDLDTPQDYRDYRTSRLDTHTDNTYQQAN